MKFKTKIFLSFIALTTVGVLLSGTILYKKMNDMVLALIEDQIIAVADTVPVFMDKRLVEDVVRGDGSGTYYDELKGLLIEATSINREQFNLVPFKNIYIAQPTKNYDEIQIIVDGYPSESDKSFPFGKIQQVDPEIVKNLQRPFVTRKLQRTKWGNYYTGSAPIVDENGNYIATLIVEVDAKVISNQFLQTLSYLVAAGMLSILIALILAGILSHLVSHSLEVIEEGVLKIEQGDYSAQIELDSHDEFEHLSNSINHMVKGLNERDRLKMGFSRYVSEYVLNQVLSSDRHFMQGERKTITVLFSDIRNFTSLSENLSAEEVVAFLNDYFNVMIDVIFRHKGTLDKFMGDGMMVIFGAPLDDENQESNAVAAAIDMQNALFGINEKLASRNVDPLQVGIGVHTGLAVVGNIGSEKRMEYTAIGDTVNIASRLEQQTKNFDENIIISDATAQKLSKEVSVVDHGKVSLKGKEVQIGIFGVNT